jgi:hypothetical protein
MRNSSPYMYCELMGQNRLAGKPFPKAPGAEKDLTRSPGLGSAAVAWSCTKSVRRAVLTMSTALASDRVVHRSDWLGFGMFS